MANYRCNFLFRQGISGWSETYFRTESSPENAFSALNALAPFRTRLMPADAELFALKVSDEAIRGDSLLQEGQTYPNFNAIVPSAGIDTSGVCALILLEAGALYKRHVFLRGIPDGMVVSSVPPPGVLYTSFLGVMNIFRNQLMSVLNGWCIKAKSKDPAVAPTLNILSFIVDLGAGTTTFSTFQPHGMQPFDRVSFYNMGKWRPVLGTRVVSAVPDATHFTIQATPPTGYGYISKGICKKVVYVYQQITQASWTQFSTRNTGRPFGLRRGRRAVAVR